MDIPLFASCGFNEQVSEKRVRETYDKFPVYFLLSTTEDHISTVKAHCFLSIRETLVKELSQTLWDGE